jgi:2-dehydropantoate 2-reductase
MRITILGTGALACLFGARLADLAEVTLVGTWPAGLAALRSGGIVLEEAKAVVARRVAAAPLGRPIEPAELVLVLVKAWQTEQVAPYLAGLLKPEGTAVTLQNGLGNLEKLGPRACLGVTTQGATLLGPGRVRSGGEGPTQLAGPAWVADILTRAGLKAHAVEAAQIDGLVWGKLAVNCGINALTALLRVPNGELLERPDARQLMERAAAECADVAEARGVRLPFTDPAAQAREVARCTAGNQSSMFQDLLRGAPTEIDAINGAVAREGRRLGRPAPVNEVLWQLVKASVKAG